MKKVLIKIGGRAASDETSLAALASEMAALQNEHSFFFVHGGGAEVTKVSALFGLEAVFENGVRKTTPAEMDVVDMVLGGRMNKYIVRLFASKGLKAVGISGADGSLFTGRAVAEGSRTGHVTAADPSVMSLLGDAGYLPVISSVSMDAEGLALNINADEAALAVASAVPVDDLIFISDIPGILKNDRVIAELSPAGIQQEIDAGVISGGMIPKVESSVKALRDGVESVIIGGYTAKGDLAKLLDGTTGTRIYNGT
ncbi:MAG: acetylglutamate kinase [Spirochaetales bacterium]|uniref:Acetylglutamate kinase n=1 Tax=Candidatus Thalassospirochaeta sargassi TaxID=3119039 RepID=A0AAJ1IJD2_9SPIO|nr:acetylglutamate kinase [Spirochaetales bacterium]